MANSYYRYTVDGYEDEAPPRLMTGFDIVKEILEDRSVQRDFVLGRVKRVVIECEQGKLDELGNPTAENKVETARFESITEAEARQLVEDIKQWEQEQLASWAERLGEMLGTDVTIQTEEE